MVDSTATNGGTTTRGGGGRCGNSRMAYRSGVLSND